MLRNLSFLLFFTFPLLLRWSLNHPITPFNTSYIEWMLWWIPPLLGILSFLLVWWIFRKKDKTVLFYSLLLFAITPATITTFTGFSSSTLIVPLALLAFISPWTAWIFLTGIFFIEPIAGILLCLAFAAYYHHKFFSLLSLAPLVLVVVVDVVIPQSTNLFAEFGNPMGFSLFIVLLGAVGVIHSWKKINLVIVGLWLLAFLTSMYVESLRVLVLIPLALYAGSEVVLLMKREWNLSVLKTASIILLACLALFVTVDHAQTIVQAQPQESLIELLDTVNEDSRSGTLLVSPEISNIAKHFSEREVVIIDFDDPLLQEVSITKLRPYFIENNVRFIISQEREEGLFFLVNNNEKFIKIATDQEYTLWLVLQEFV